MKRLVIIDDEKRTRDLISRMVESFHFQIEVAGLGESVQSGIQLLEKEKPDIVLLDIQLPDGTGFDVLRSCSYTDFKVIFITAHEEFAIKAIKFSALDYILKPVDPDELHNAIKKAIETIEDSPGQKQLDALQSNTLKEKKRRLVLKTQESVFVVDLYQIIRCEADRNYTTFFLETGNKIVVSKTLKEYELLLSGHNFLRVQQSHLINIDYVDRYDKMDGGAVVMKDGSQVPLSASKREIFFKILENL